MHLEDGEIQQYVMEQLRYDPRVEPAEIGVTVKDGVVTLTGSVESFTEKWAAEEVALRVAGVKAVANEIKVTLAPGSERTDEEIARAAKQILESSHDIPDTVNVSVENGWITLHGEVEWQYQRQAAEQKLRDIAGVLGVTNLIAVTPKEKPEDLKRRIESALKRAAEIEAKNIQVDVQDGRVVLRGHVHSLYEKQEAKWEAWLAPGVREVVDELTIA